MFWRIMMLQVKNDINLNIDKSPIFQERNTHTLYLSLYLS